MHHWQYKTGIHTIVDHSTMVTDYTLTDHHVTYIEIMRYYCTFERTARATFIS